MFLRTFCGLINLSKININHYSPGNFSNNITYTHPCHINTLLITIIRTGVSRTDGNKRFVSFLNYYTCKINTLNLVQQQKPGNCTKQKCVRKHSNQEESFI